MRYLKTNFGKNKAFGKLMELLSLETFVSVEQADKLINWDDMGSFVV
jgi:hypothetical protein